MSPSAYLRSWRPRSRNAVPLLVLFVGLAGVGLVLVDARHRDAECGGCIVYHVSLPALLAWGAVALLGAIWYRTKETTAFVDAAVRVGDTFRLMRSGQRATDPLVRVPVPAPAPPLDVPPVDGFDDAPTPFADEPSPAPPQQPGVGHDGGEG